MKVLGIDPGTAALGYGIVERTGGRLREVDHGCLTTSPDLSLPERLLAIHTLVDELLELHEPDLLGVERLFFSRNVQTALGVGQARGVVLLAAAQHGTPVREATPSEVKSAIAGYGAADKAQVQRMVQLVLGHERAAEARRRGRCARDRGLGGEHGQRRGRGYGQGAGSGLGSPDHPGRDRLRTGRPGSPRGRAHRQAQRVLKRRAGDGVDLFTEPCQPCSVGLFGERFALSGPGSEAFRAWIGVGSWPGTTDCKPNSPRTTIWHILAGTPVIASVEGVVGAVAADSLVIEVGGIGYRVFAAPAVLAAAQPGGRLKLHTFHLVREDQQALYGFRSTEELGFFTLLLTVNGVGPKVALAIVGSRPTPDLQLAIMAQDQAVLVAIPGIGKKLAERIIFELKEKVTAAGVSVAGPSVAGGAASEGEIVAALQALGYSLAEAREASRAALADVGRRIDARGAGQGGAQEPAPRVTSAGAPRADGATARPPPGRAPVGPRPPPPRCGWRHRACPGCSRRGPRPCSR